MDSIWNTLRRVKHWVSEQLNVNCKMYDTKWCWLVYTCMLFIIQNIKKHKKKATETEDDDFGLDEVSVEESE